MRTHGGYRHGVKGGRSKKELMMRLYWERKGAGKRRLVRKKKESE